MINNRQAGRRNRGRNNNGRPNGGNRGGGDNGNRIDNRARGNAAQLLEKYKNMARDAQMAGDRVNAEYYLQFADHYFRVLADNRARQEEQQQRFRPRDESFEDHFDDFEAAEEGGEDVGTEQAFERPQGHERRREDYREARAERGDRNRRDRNERNDRNDRNDRRREQPVAQQDAEQPQREVVAEAARVAEAAPEPQPEAEAPRPRRGRPRKTATAKDDSQEGLDLAVLPPSIARADNDAEPAEEAAPRKRTRRARPAAEAAE
ncbi:DUF4167 domain-containing protein [Sphingobium estronivorans]|uniref:DUF4167 domain-containing protein n=1 Tax=Sphingobium estronivorans TaxID=1577690 RepID=UPI0012397B91|nr:DUF4167 domain-containing protein [Sphingobium estronivorans]